MGKKKEKSAGNRFPNADPNNLISMIESRYSRLVKALDVIDDKLPETAPEGTAADLQEMLNQLTKAQVNVCELIAYRKLLGVD